jgi:hypothetical protein
MVQSWNHQTDGQTHLRPVKRLSIFVTSTTAGYTYRIWLIHATALPDLKLKRYRKFEQFQVWSKSYTHKYFTHIFPLQSMSINSELVLPYTILSFTDPPPHQHFTHGPPDSKCQPPVIPERLNLLHWTGSDIARASTFQFFSTGFMHSWFIYLFSPFTFSYLNPSFVYYYSHLFSSFIRQLLIPFSLYSSVVSYCLYFIFIPLGSELKLRPVAEFNFQQQTKYNNSF